MATFTIPCGAGLMIDTTSPILQKIYRLQYRVSLDYSWATWGTFPTRQKAIERWRQLPTSPIQWRIV